MNWKTAASLAGLAGVCGLVGASTASAQGTPGAAGAPRSRGQNAPGGPGGPGGMAQMPPEMLAKMKAWQKWNDAHKPIGDLQTLLRKVSRLDQESGAELTKPQAVKMLAIMKPWRTKTEMTNDQANGVMKAVTTVLTPTQVAKLATMQGRRGGGVGGSPGGGGPGRPGGGADPARASGPPGTAPGGAGGGRPGMAGGAAGGRMGGGMDSGGRMGGGGRPGMTGGPGGFKIPDPPKTGYNPLNPATLPFEQQRPRAKKNLDEFTAALQAKAK